MLKDGLELPKRPDDTQREYRFARDNTIAALGKVIYCHRDIIDLQKDMEVWLTHLPLCYDREESYEQTTIMITILSRHIDLIIPQDGRSAPLRINKLLKILGDVISKELYRS